MLRFGISLVAAGFIALAGYSALGRATSPAGPHLKVIATVVARAHHHTRLTAAETLRGVPVLQ